ncbi:MAG: insulinase family protein [Candidatus Eremiobacteraeota bacterium]|nr:insulinase family protein [Candidatus Eremiobacteraeota bacterium]
MSAPLAAAALAAALAAPAAAPTAPPATPRTAVVDVGGAKGYVRADRGVSLAGVGLLVRAGLDRQTTAQNGLAALVAQAVLQTPVAPASGPGPAVALTDAVESAGASVGFAVSTQHVRFYLEGTPPALARAGPLLARAFAAPSFDPATLAAARAALAERISESDDDTALVGLQMLRSTYYRGGAGFPSLGDPSATVAYAPADARAFFERWYLRGDAVVTEVGRTGPETDAAGRALVAALHAGSAPGEELTARAPAASPKRIVTQRPIGATFVVLGFAAPPLGDRDFPAALVIRALLEDVFERTAATTPPAVFRRVGTIYGYDAAPAQLSIWMNGALIDPATGLAAIEVLSKGTAAKPLNAATLARYKDTAHGAWVLETISLDQRAFAIGNAVAHGLDPDANDAVGEAIRRVTAADVQRVAKKYFQRFDVALIVPREGGS